MLQKPWNKPFKQARQYKNEMIIYSQIGGKA